MKLIAFNGSPRKGGNTEALLEAVMAPVRQAGIETELVQIGGKGIHGCLGCYTCQKRKDSRCSQNDDMLNACLEKVIAADALLLGSPTYFTDVTADMKAFIDRVVAVRRAGATHALDTMTHLFQISGMIMPGSSYWTMGYGLNPREALGDQEGVATMQNLGENIAWLMHKLAG